MGKQRTTVTIGDYRLVRFDRLNWLLEEYRTADPASHLTRDGRPKWFSTGHYFQRVGAGVSWLLEHEMLEDGGEYDLAGAVARFDEIATGLRAHVTDAVSGGAL